MHVDQGTNTGIVRCHGATAFGALDTGLYVCVTVDTVTIHAHAGRGAHRRSIALWGFHVNRSMDENE